MSRETEKHSLMMIGGVQIGGPRPGGRNQDGNGMTKSEDFLLTEDFAPTLWQLLCVRRVMHTHSVSHAHFSDTVSVRDVQTSRKRMAQGVCSAHVTSLHLALSILMFHPPSLLFPHGHCETTFPSALSSSSCTRPERGVQVHFRTSAEEFGYLADFTHSTPMTFAFHILGATVREPKR